MNCPFCRGDSKVIDSRPIPDGIRRRRECLQCERRFSTYEKIIPLEIRVLKAGVRPPEDFQPEKIKVVLRRVCKGRPISMPQIEDITRTLEADLSSAGRSSVRSSDLAHQVAELLMALDEVAYSRFIANYIDVEGRVALERQEPRRSVTANAKQLRLFGGD